MMKNARVKGQRRRKSKIIYIGIYATKVAGLATSVPSYAMRYDDEAHTVYMQAPRAAKEGTESRGSKRRC